MPHVTLETLGLKVAEKRGSGNIRDAAKEVGFDVCEVHTGPYASEFLKSGGDLRQSELVDAIERFLGFGQLTAGLLQLGEV